MSRRNAIVHRGLQILWADARESFQATMAVEGSLLTVQDEVLDLLPLDEDDLDGS